MKAPPMQMLAAAVLSTLAVAHSGATVQVGPGPAKVSLRAGQYRIDLGLTPNRALCKGVLTISLRKGDATVAGAQVGVRMTMLDMPMGSYTTVLRERRAGM